MDSYEQRFLGHENRQKGLLMFKKEGGRPTAKSGYCQSAGQGKLKFKGSRIEHHLHSSIYN